MVDTVSGSRSMRSTAALVLITGVGPFATDTYLAGLPAMRESLSTTATVAQLTLTAFIVGLAGGQLVLGPISDALGRRRLVLGGAVVFTACSVVCALAPSGALLVAARLGQGLAAGTGVVVGRAVVTDTYDDRSAAAMFGTLASITFLGPVIAPALGGVILAFASWRAVFWVLAAFGLAMVVAVAWWLPESLPVERRQAGNLRAHLSRIADLATDWSYTRHVLTYCLTAAGFFTYIGGSAFVLQTAYHVGPSFYAVIFAVNAASMAVTGLAFRALVGRLGAVRLRAIGVTMSTAAAGGLLAVALLDRGAAGPVELPWALFCLVVAGTGLTVPATTALAQAAGRRSAGSASALQGGAGFFVGALVSPLTGAVGYTALLPMAVFMAVFYVAAFAMMVAVSAGASSANRE